MQALAGTTRPSAATGQAGVAKRRKGSQYKGGSRAVQFLTRISNATAVLSIAQRLAGGRVPAPLSRHGGRACRQQQTVRYRPDTAPAEVATNGVYKPVSKDSKQQVQEMLAALRALTDEASTLQSKLLGSLAVTAAPAPAPPATAAVQTAPFAVVQSTEVPENVLSARAWIAAWRTKQPALAVEAATPASSAVIASAASCGAIAVQVPENVASARAWISAWKAKQPVVTVAALPSTAVAAAAADSGAASVPAAKPVAGAPGAKPAAAAAAPKRADGYTNTNRYWVPANLAKRFLEVIADRKAAMQKFEGFVGLTVKEPAGSSSGAPTEGEYVVASSWASVPAWEAWSLGGGNQQHQIPTGIWQFVPSKGQGFPEDYLPFKDFAGEIPNAKY